MYDVILDVFSTFSLLLSFFNYSFVVNCSYFRGDHTQQLAARWQRLGDEELGNINNEDKEDQESDSGEENQSKKDESNL